MTMRNSLAAAIAAAIMAVFLSVAVQPAKAATMSITQTFDTAVSASNAGWTTFRSTSGSNNYGWNVGNEVSGTGGQAGGIFTRTSSGSAGYYADLTIGQSGTTSGTLDRALETLTMSGLLNFSNTDFNGAIRLGYFNSGTFGATGNPFIGLSISEPSGATTDPMRIFATVDSGSSTATPILINQNQTYSFSLTWTPTGGGAGTLAGLVAGTSVNLTAPAGTGVFNAFGIMNGFSANSAPALNTAGSYVDNLTYSVVPEPETLAMAGVGVASAVMGRELRRRKKVIATRSEG
jgi:hypothetical protein